MWYHDKFGGVLGILPISLTFEMDFKELKSDLYGLLPHKLTRGFSLQTKGMKSFSTTMASIRPINIPSLG